MTINYPDEILRGIPNNSEQFITAEGYPTQSAFKFDDYDPERQDGYCELSINWVDDERAVDVLLQQINSRKGTPQFQGGYCRFQLTQLLAMKAYIDNGHIKYERKPIEADEINGIAGNKYHGNILMKNELSKPTKTNIQVALAAIAGLVIPRDSNDSL